ncbi:MAG: MerR family transcriptional regulator [Thermoanaerobaculia bacterium]
MSDAGEKRLYKIGEVCKMADVQPYVLRYWETEFPVLAPNKSGGGQRMYTQHEIDVVLRIKQLLYSEGFTIAGAKKKLEADLTDGTPLATKPAETRVTKKKSSETTKTLHRVRDELRAILAMLDE